MSGQSTSTRRTAPETIHRTGAVPGPAAARSEAAKRGPTKEKWMCRGASGVAGVLLVLFVLDFIMKLTGSISFRPFGALDYVVDVVGAVAAAILIYLSIDALRSLR